MSERPRIEANYFCDAPSPVRQLANTKLVNSDYTTFKVSYMFMFPLPYQTINQHIAVISDCATFKVS